MYACGAARGDERRGNSNEHQQRAAGGVRNGIGRPDLEEHSRQCPGHAQSSDNAERDTDAGHQYALTYDLFHDVGRGGAKCEANANLMAAL